MRQSLGCKAVYLSFRSPCNIQYLPIYKRRGFERKKQNRICDIFWLPTAPDRNFSYPIFYQIIKINSQPCSGCTCTGIIYKDIDRAERLIGLKKGLPCPKHSAIALPIPLPAPVTTAVLLLKRAILVPHPSSRICFLDFAFNQRPAQNFSNCRFWQHLFKFDNAGNLISGQLVLAPLYYFLLGQ
jgi:hypothetical protein